jgi:DNA primase
MSGRIPQTFIDDLLERVDIVEIIDSRIPLRKTGRNYSALCPFHQEKTPSFSVNPDKQFYYCFGCGAGGNVASFLMDYERLEFPQAVEQLARHIGVEIPRDEPINPEKISRQRNIYTQLEQAASYYQQQLKEHPQASRATDYLKKRGLSGDIAKQFGIGYAPPGWDNLLNQLGKSDEDRSLLLEGGMLIEKEDGGCYDRFRDRIIFPIRDNRGRVVAFGGRVLGDDKPKYLNSPETAVFSKSRELYGLYEARQANRHLDKIIIVEGYMDVVALAQHGISFATATLGTATSEKHLEKVFRHTSEVIFCFDGDEAGRKAAARALEAALPQMQDGRQARFLFLSEGEDPDSLVRQYGGEHFNTLINKALPLEEHLFESASQAINLDTMEGRARLSKIALPLIQKLPEGMFKRLMTSSLADRTGLAQHDLQQLISQQAAQQEAKAAKSDQPHNPQARLEGKSGPTHPHQPVKRPALSEQQKRLELNSARKAIMLLLNYPHLASGINPDAIQESAEDKQTDTDLALLKELLEKLRDTPFATPHLLLGHWLNKPSGELLMQLLAKDPTINPEGAQRELDDCVKHLTQINKRRTHNQLINQLSDNKSLTFNELSDDLKIKLKALFSDTER